MRKVLANNQFCVFAAGVSNSGCTDSTEFSRDRARLTRALSDHMSSDRFLYFSTCSVDDPLARGSMYVQHKLELETLVREHPRYLVFRLPQVAGRTANPHTLLNYLYARITRSEKFSLWVGSRRNFLDVDDIARIVAHLVMVEQAVCETINVANTESVSVIDVVRTFEEITGKTAVYHAEDLGSRYDIDCSRIAMPIERCGIELGGDYLFRTLDKYYGNAPTNFDA
jgi:nucleoside-diphosphate-sugar epimerase